MGQLYSPAVVVIEAYNLSMPFSPRSGMCLSMILLLAACGKQPEPPPEKPDTQESPDGLVQPPPKSSTSTPAQRARLAHVPFKPYRIALAFADLQQELREALPAALGRRWGQELRRFETVALDEAVVKSLLLAPAAPALTGAMASRLARFDQLLLIGRDRRGGLLLREWYPHLGQLSSQWHGPAARGAAARGPILEGAAEVLSWTARVVSVSGKKARLIMTGVGLLFGRPLPVSPGDFGPFDYHQPGGLDRFQPVRGSYGQITAQVQTPLGLELEVQVLGWYAPKPGDRWRRLYLPGGERELQVITTDGAPQSGMVVYAHARQFSRQHDDFAGTTNHAGKVRLKARAGQVRYVQVISTVQGVEFTFYQGILPIAAGLPPWLIRIADFASLTEQASQVRNRLLNGEEMRQLRRRIQTLLDTSALMVRGGRYRDALSNMEKAGKLLSGVKNADATRLRQMVAQLRKKYEENEARQKLIKSRTEVLKVLSRADDAIYAGQFPKGVTLLTEAQKRWPAKLFPERSELIAKKLAQARRLVKQAQSEVGLARGSLLVAIDKLQQKQLSLEALGQLETQIKLVRERGVKDLKIPYSDTELLSRLKVKLDRIAQAYVVELKQLTDAYDNSEDEAQRQQLYQRSERIARFRTQVDKLLGLLVLD